MTGSRFITLWSEAKREITRRFALLSSFKSQKTGDGFLVIYRGEFLFFPKLTYSGL